MFKCEIKKGVNKNTGNTYIGLIVTFPNGYEKYVPLEKAEKYMAEQILVNDTI